MSSRAPSARGAPPGRDHRPEPPGARSTGGSGWSASRSWRGRYDVTVICPQGEGTGPDQVVDGVRILAYPGYAPGGGAVGYVVEYAWSFLATARLAAHGAAGRSASTSLQACNPPDIFWPIARWLRRRDGTRFVFDHHDLCPELYLSRFDGSRAAPTRACSSSSAQTFRAADRVTSTNESYADDRRGPRRQGRRARHASCAPGRTRSGCGAASRS